MRKKMGVWIILALVLAIAAYLVYFGIIIFSFQKEVGTDYETAHPASRFYSPAIGPDKALIVDSPGDAAAVRADMIEQAKETLDISYYSAEAGQSTNVFWSLLLEAADRGVRIRMILDGMANGVMMKQKDVLYALKAHPNIELRLYERPNLALPWTFNNRLHDKYIIADHKTAVLGGRNISDRFLAPDHYKGEIAYDRDVVVYNAGTEKEGSVINELERYFNEVYDSPYAKNALSKLGKQADSQGRKKREGLKKLLEETRKEAELKAIPFNWKEKLIETNKITLIHNPIARFNKEPWVLFEIKRLMGTADQEAFFMSPYIVSSRNLSWSFLGGLNRQADVRILTNSRGSTPNFPAFSSYLLQRKKLVESGIQIYEYQGEHSIHTKTYLVDDDISIIGSFNMDPRSAYFSTETMLVIHGEKLHKQASALNNIYLEKSLLIGPDGEYVVEEGSVEERIPGRMKTAFLKVCGYLTHFFSYLL